MEEMRQRIYYRQLEEGLNPNKISIFYVEIMQYVEYDLTPKKSDDYFINEMDLKADTYKGLNLYTSICNFLNKTFEDYNKRHGYVKELAKEWLLHTRLLARGSKAKEEINEWCDIMEQQLQQAAPKQDNPQPGAAGQATDGTAPKQDKTAKNKFEVFVIRVDIKEILWEVLKELVETNKKEHPAKAIKYISAAEYAGYITKLEPSDVNEIFGAFAQSTCSKYSKNKLNNATLEEFAKVINGKIEATQKGKAEP